MNDVFGCRDDEEFARRIDRAPEMAAKQKKGKRGKGKKASALDVCFGRMRALVDNADIPICNRIRFLMRDVIVGFYFHFVLSVILANV